MIDRRSNTEVLLDQPVFPNATTVKVGQVWRQEDGYLCKVMAINAKGWPYVRHVNAKQGGHLVNPAWFSTEHWTLVRDV